MKQIMTAFAILSIIVLSGCTSARKEAMMPDSLEITNSYPHSISIGYAGEHVRDARSRNPNAAVYFGNSNATTVNADTFMETVIASVEASGLFKNIMSKDKADYRLDVNIISEIAPSPGGQMKSTLVTAWRLTRNKDNKVISDELIEKTHKATPGSFVGVRTAIEGAVRDSITEGIKRLAKPGVVK